MKHFKNLHRVLANILSTTKLLSMNKLCSDQQKNLLGHNGAQIFIPSYKKITSSLLQSHIDYNIANMPQLILSIVQMY